jgi:hypothetical protein
LPKVVGQTMKYAIACCHAGETTSLNSTVQDNDDDDECSILNNAEHFCKSVG